MSKTKRKWIAGCNSDSEPNVAIRYNNPDALRAWDVPYDASWNVWQAINYGLSGVQGPQGFDGPTGVQGYTGVGPAGVTGMALGATGVGYTGVQGPAGIGIQGVTGIYGLTGLQGVPGFGLTGLQGFTGLGITGLPGIIGSTGIGGFTGVGSGATGPQGPVGFFGVTGIQGSTGVLQYGGPQGNTGIQGSPGTPGTAGSQGTTGLPGLGSTGLQGATGLSGGSAPSLTTLFNPVSRYSVVTTTGSEIWLVSSSTVFGGLTWNSAGGILTMNRASHGHAPGDRVILRNTTADFESTVINTVTTNSFTVSIASPATASGVSGAYSLGFTYTTFAGGGTLNAPAGDHADCQLISMRIRTGSRPGTTYDLIVPPSAINGAGNNTSLADCYIPDFNVRFDADNLTAIGATMVTNISGSYSTFQFGNLGALSRMISLHF